MSDILTALPQHYRLILCDLWGCVHNGVTILPGVVERLDAWQTEGRTIVFLTNAPRPSSAVAEQLGALGLPDRLNGQIVSSGDVALVHMRDEERSRSSTFLGSQADRRRLEAAGLDFVAVDRADTVICSGFDERGFDIDDYMDELGRLAASGVEMLCLNPDRVVHRGDRAEPCAGAIAASYAAMGGKVRLFGKPYRDIYDHAIRYAEADVDRNEVIAIGDSISTDYVGAVNANIDFIFVAGGIDGNAWQTHAERVFDNAPGLEHSPVAPFAVVPVLGQKVKERMQ